MSKSNSLLTFNELLYFREKQDADMVYLRQPLNGVWHDITWAEAMTRARKVTTFLKGLGLEKGDRVAILSKNCAEWFIADFAIAMGGFVSVPLFTTHPENTVKYIFEHSEAKVVFVGKLDAWQDLERGIPDSVQKIDFGYPNSMPAQHHWKDILETSIPDPDNHVPNLDDLYSIIYTSGTTGNPKGVTLPFGAIVHVKPTYESVGFYGEYPHNFMLSYLPLGHIFERMTVEYASIMTPMTVSFVESLATFSQNIRDTSPTLFVGVPRIWAQFQKGILAKLPQNKLDLLLKIPILSGFIKKKIKRELGLARSATNLSGSAPIAPSLLEWFKTLDIEILEGYGRTEDLAIATVGVKGNHKVGTVGKPFQGVEIKIAETGEILTRSKTMMSGYYKNPDATKEVMTDDGFLRTGDAGHFDSEGNLVIEGRINDSFKTDKGEFVNPIPIESAFAQNPDIDQACLIGLGLPQPVLLAVLGQNAREKPREEVIRSLEATLESINVNLSKFEKIAHIFVVNDAWTPENNLLTPTLKLKRQVLNCKYSKMAQESIKNPELVIWEP